MKRMKISPLVTLAIATQMIVSPFAHAVNPLEVVQMAGQIINQNQQAIQAQRNAQANQQLVAQMTQQGRDKYFNADVFARIPGLNAATFTCPTLPTTLTEIKAEVCRLGVTNDRGANPQAQLGEMFSLYKTYGDVSKQYEAYLSNSNAEGQGFGVGCMRNAVQTLNSFMSAKNSELDEYMKNIARLHDQFKEQSKIDLNAIEESTAVLEGGNSELADEVRSRRPDLFEFGKRFENPACKSMYAGDAINNIGKGAPGGLNQIARNMREQYSGKAQGAKFSGEAYVSAHSSVIEDINKMANSAAEQFKLNFQGITGEANGFSQFLGDLPNSISSTSGLNRSQLSNDFFADVQQKFNKQNADIMNDLSVLQEDIRAAGGDASSALRLANNLNAKNFENEVVRVQNQIRNGCVQRAFGGQGFWDDIRKNIKDPQASKFANKNEFNALRQRIQDIMTNETTTPENKIAQLRSLEQAEGGRFILNQQGSYQKTTMVNGKAVTTNEAPSNSAPSKYFNDIVTTCDAQFSVQKFGTSTGAGAIQKLRDINTQYKNLASAQMNNIRNEIRNKLINCENANEANNSEAGSCTKDRFNTNAPGFCANAAFTCANNMKSCSAQAEGFVKQIKAERTARVQKYKQNMEANKQQIKQMVSGIVESYGAIGKAIAGLNLGATFNFPTPEYDVKGDGKFLDSFRAATQSSPDGALLLEDPDRYFQLMKTNVEKMKASLAKTQQELTGRGGALAQHIEQTQRNYTAAKAKADEIANNCINKHDDFVRQSDQQRQQQLAEQQKKMNELGEKRQEFCARFSMLNSNPSAACEGQLRENIQIGLQFDPSGDSSREFSQVCNRQQSETQSSTSGNPSLQAARLCARYGTAPANQLGTRQTADTGPSPVTETREAAIKIYCGRIADKPGFCANTAPEPTTANPNPRPSWDCSDLFNAIIVQAELITNPNSGIQVANSGSSGRGSDDGGAPAFCNAGYNGDRNDGSLMGGGNRLQIIAEQLGVGSRVQGN